jgi:hypothetical protein
MQFTFSDIMHGWVEQMKKEEADGHEVIAWLQEQIHDDSDDRIRETILEPRQDQIKNRKAVAITEGMIFQFYPDSLRSRLQEIRKENEHEPMRYLIAKASISLLAGSLGEFVLWRMFWNDQYNSIIMLGMFHRVSSDVIASRESGDLKETEDGMFAFRASVNANSHCGFLILDDVSPLMVDGKVNFIGRVDVETRLL